ncbi:MAG: TolC family protein [Bacteroidota bacterium]|nr:TolC family protein [Bacteroidota bacterium]
MNISYFISLVMCISTIVYGQQVKLENSLSLEEAISIALKSNPEIRSSEERINATKGRFWSGISPVAPELSVNYEFVPKGQSFSNYGEKSIELSQAFEFPTSYFLRSSKYSFESEIARTEFLQTQISLTSRVKEAYYNVLFREQMLVIAKENLSIAEDFYKKAEIRANCGEGTNLERLTAKVQYSEAQNNLESSLNRLKSSYSDLNFVLGKDKQNDYSYKLTDSLDFKPAEFTLDKLYDEAILINPEMKISELRLNSSSVDKKLAWSGLLPGFSLSYFNQSQNGSSGFYGGSFAISVPLWFMFDQRGKIEEASALALASEAEMRLTKNSVFLKINKAFSNLKNAEKQVLLFQKEILPQSEEIYRAAFNSFDAGEISYLEFLQAKQTVISSRGSFLNSLLDYNMALVSLEEATGKRFR